MSSLTVIQSDSSLLHRVSDEGITVADKASKKYDSSNRHVPFLRVVDDSYMEWLRTQKRSQHFSSPGRIRRPRGAMRTRLTQNIQSAVAGVTQTATSHGHTLPIVSDSARLNAQPLAEKPTHTSFSIIGRVAAWVAAFILVVSAGAVMGSLFSPAYSEPTETYIVQQGDTMWDLARGSSAGNIDDTVATIVSLNALETTQLTPGQKLELPVHPSRLK